MARKLHVFSQKHAFLFYYIPDFLPRIAQITRIYDLMQIIKLQNQRVISMGYKIGVIRAIRGRIN